MENQPPQPPPQPNYVAMGEAYATLRDNTLLFPNVEGPQQQALLQQVLLGQQQQQQQFQQFQQQFQQFQQQVQQNFDNLCVFLFCVFSFLFFA
jgi:hypothetical protein